MISLKSCAFYGLAWALPCMQKHDSVYIFEFIGFCKGEEKLSEIF